LELIGTQTLDPRDLIGADRSESREQVFLSRLTLEPFTVELDKRIFAEALARLPCWKELPILGDVDIIFVGDARFAIVVHHLSSNNNRSSFQQGS
jgi:hypothetical protein